MANTVSNDYIISALLNTNSMVYCIDGDKLVGDDESSDFYSVMRVVQPQDLRLPKTDLISSSLLTRYIRVISCGKSTTWIRSYL